ncbi:Random slug protein 5 [Durusdinium trenchii]|uniref:Random slug protein 5 n=1 Tax=Durusdinium trenchii TaxID=1381693 RepID=A0ABP0J7Q4_9DINO
MSMSEWQKEWCTPFRVSLYLRGRNGDVMAAGKLVAKALEWRRQHWDLLTGQRTPIWQGDMRILCQGGSGHPLLYTSHRFQTQSYNQRDMVEHAAVVLETAVKMMPQHVHQLDAVLDLKHFQLRYNLDPRGVIGAGELLKYAFRDVLRSIMIVDAPAALSVLWSLVKPTLPEGTQRKVVFLPAEKALEFLD